MVLELFFFAAVDPVTTPKADEEVVIFEEKLKPLPLTAAKVNGLAVAEAPSFDREAVANANGGLFIIAFVTILMYIFALFIAFLSSFHLQFISNMR